MEKTVLVRIGGPDLFDAMENANGYQEEPEIESQLLSGGIRQETDVQGDTQFP
jgi:hypothetical protein